MNNQQPKFDPETGRPLSEQPNETVNQPKFDPETGRPLTQPAEASEPQPRFDPQTGRPLGEQPVNPAGFAQPQQLNIPPVPPAQPEQPVQLKKAPANGLAIGSLVCGIVSLVCCCCSGWFSLILGGVAILLAILSKKGQKMSGMALGGLICGIIGAAFGVIAVIASLFVLTDASFMEEFIQSFEEGLNSGNPDFYDEYYYYSA